MTDDERFEWIEKRVTAQESLASTLREEISGLCEASHGMIEAARAQNNALDGYHKAYAAARQRAEIAESSSAKLTAEIRKLETLMKKLTAEVHRNSAERGLS